MVSQPRRNRVTPFGVLEANPAKGALMGNRGDLQDRSGNIARSWKVKRWIACGLTHPRGLLVTFDTPGSYTPLFFADEPTALAAGHRPCAECRRADYDAYREGWRLAFGATPKADEMDTALHAARLAPDGTRTMPEARLGDLPDGVMVSTQMAPGTAHLKWRGRLFPWSHEGYGAPIEVDDAIMYRVITPMPSVKVLAALQKADALPWPGFALPRI